MSNIDDWWPQKPVRYRRGRSDTGVHFATVAPGSPIRSQNPYSFADALAHQNELITERENSDPEYCGDVALGCSCIPAPKPQFPTDMDSSDSEESLVPTVRHPSPELDAPILRREDSLVPTVRHSSPELDELNSDSEALAAPSKSVIKATRPTRLVTYLKRDRLRHGSNGEVRAQQEAAKAAAKVSAKAKADAKRLRRRSAVPTRRSMRMHRARVSDLTNHGAWSAETALLAGHVLHTLHELPRPLVDKKNFIMGVISAGPKGGEVSWNGIITDAARDLARAYRRGTFADFGEKESVISLGIGFEDWPGPHNLRFVGPNADEMRNLQQSPALAAISDYHNHLYRQFAPVSHSAVARSMDSLLSRKIAKPAFSNSVFTTSQVRFCDVPSLSQKTFDSNFLTMEAITSVGTYAKARGHIIFFDDEGTVEFPPGSTALFPAGTKRFSFAPVAAHETRYLFRQFCHASVLRWLEKDGQGDTEFEHWASADQISVWEAKRASRGLTAIKNFSKLNDIYVI
ncbi:hypothetical protein C8R43DRAFT_1135849 [Mycena crocata]|nr:hypothetical protein C8R43DRAFT_1135849 [Mycena crocata]